MEQVDVQEACSERPGLLRPEYDSDPTAAEGDGSGSGSPPPLPLGHQLSQLVAPLDSRCDSEAPEGSDAARSGSQAGGSDSDDASSSSDSEAGLLKRVPAMRVGASYQAVLPPEAELGGPSAEAERPSPDELVWRPDEQFDMDAAAPTVDPMGMGSPGGHGSPAQPSSPLANRRPRE